MAANLDNGVMLGALGSAHTDGTTPISPPTNMVIVAIQMITKNTIVRLVAEEPTRFFNTVTAAHNAGTITEDETTDLGTGGGTVSGCSFPAGMTIYGRWTRADFAADSVGGVICYFGY